MFWQWPMISRINRRFTEPNVEKNSVSSALHSGLDPAAFEAAYFLQLSRSSSVSNVFLKIRAIPGWPQTSLTRLFSVVSLSRRPVSTKTGISAVFGVVRSLSKRKYTSPFGMK